MTMPHHDNRCYSCCRINKMLWNVVSVWAIFTLLQMVTSGSIIEQRCIVKKPYDAFVHKEVYKVGVLAIRGIDAAYREFNKTFSDYLTATAGQRFDPPIRFEMAPLNFIEVLEAADERRVDYIYVNPSLYSCVESEYKAQSLVSQVSRRVIGNHVYNLNQFAGVIIARHDNERIRTIRDLKNKIIATASISGLGSGQMQFKQMIDARMSYINDPKQIVFTSNQNKIVHGVINGEFDVGFVRTDQIERTRDANGTLIDPSLLKVIDPVPNLTIAGNPFPFQASTELYPEYNIAALDHVPGDVSEELQAAMLAVAEHGEVGAMLESCLYEFNASYCDTLDFPYDFSTRDVRCDTTKEVALLAREAMDAGRYTEFRTTLSYMQLRSMQEATGFILFDEEINRWYCVRGSDLYDTITCPAGHYLKSRDQVERGCADAGLVCAEGFRCICSPCVEPLICTGHSFPVMNLYCMSYAVLFLAIIIPICGVIAIIVSYYVAHKRKQADHVWLVAPEELKFGDPPEVLGQGTFGLVLLAEYRGTNVAVKRVIPPQPKGSKNRSWSLQDFFRARPGSKEEQTIDDESLSKFDNMEHFDLEEDDIESRPSGNKNNEQPLMVMTTLSSSFEIMHDELTEVEASEVSNTMKSVETFVQDKFLKRGKRESVFAMKTIKKSEYSRLRTDFIDEMRHLSKLRHPCITTVMGAVISKREDPMLLMEYMNHGSLYDLLHNESMIFEGEFVLPIMRDVAQGMRFLHSANPQIIHGDLKSHNILVDARFRAKVADFGLSQKRRVGVSGTTYWMAPELLRGESFNTSASDIYSLGIVLYELYSRKDPYDGEDHDEVLRQVCHPHINKRPPVPDACPPKVAQLMKDCLAANPIDRPIAADIDLTLKVLDFSHVEPTRRLSHKKMRIDYSNERNTQLLYDVFPKHIADALAAGKKVEPESHELVTIFFSDIVGFTTISGSFSPIQVSNMLDRLYSAFDRLATKHEVFKIETAGDAYMAVSNLVQNQSKDHVKRMTEFAIDAIEAASRTLIDQEDLKKGFVQIRVGLHSGPVVSNVVGSLNPKFGIFGDTVNTAARMESNSVAGKIHCSKRSALLLMEQAPEIPLSLRGEIAVKGKGEMTTYFVNDEKHRLSNDFMPFFRKSDVPLGELFEI